MSLVHKTLARSASELMALRPLWDRLLKRNRKTMFQRFEWNWLAAEIFRERFLPAVAAVESDAGAAIIPACINLGTSRLELLGESLFDYRDVLHVGEADVLRAAWEVLGEFNLPLSITAVEASAVHDWSDFPATEFVSAPWVDASRMTEREFRSAHSRVGSRLRRIQRKGVILHDYSGAQSELVRHLYHLKCDQFASDENNIFRTEARRAFMVAIAAREAENCRIFTLEDGTGCIVAGLVTFLDAAIRRFYTIYFDPAWAAHSPGVTLVFEVTARSLAQGLNCDYMTGEYPYKLRFANASRMLFRVEASTSDIRTVAQRPRQLRIA
jgi:CelD/BcsL family acetyltransferase involved in cellulose biosynthesis